MKLLGIAIVLLVSVCADSATSWGHAEAQRRYAMQKPKPIKFQQEDADKFMLELMEKIEDMPQPDDPKYEFIRDKFSQVQVCQIPEDDDNSMEESASADDVMSSVMRSFADGKCAGRSFGEWYYQVCGNMEVKRSPFTYGGISKKGGYKVIPFKAAESLGVLGRNRRVSSHLASVNDPRYVEQTYYEGIKCNLEGDERRMQTTVTFECNPRFVRGYVHVNDVREENACHTRVQLQSTDFCEDDWLVGVTDSTSVIRCRLYYHPDRVKPLTDFLDKYYEEAKARQERYSKWLDEPERKAILMRKLSVPDAKKYLEKWSLESVRTFDKQDLQYGQKAEDERISRMLAYVISELTWASLNPGIPYTEEEQKSRKAEEKHGQREDHRHLTNLKNVLEVRREEFMGELYEDDEHGRFKMEMNGYGTLLRMSDVNDYLRDPHVNFYASWLDYINDKAAEDMMVVRSMLIPPNRENALGSFLLLENLIQSDYADSLRSIFSDLLEEETKPEEHLLYDGEFDDLEELSRQFMTVYKAVKKGVEANNFDLVLDLLDDEDFEY
ncbi:hypothetical protein PFISCL1PPCAC_12193 [Pristionchus fissidentatus]|uniref:Endoplasmic reticulum lectin 1 n=1 Tax=Pristionchus fissidentatus TaxID=1538716 RepID=A0AAV5VMQ5_9BILA|nr:hypothetical protein PFISCL1PPCAC_12193 [Pristionchus fissidentatus]